MTAQPQNYTISLSNSAICRFAEVSLLLQSLHWRLKDGQCRQSGLAVGVVWSHYETSLYNHVLKIFEIQISSDGGLAVSISIVNL